MVKVVAIQNAESYIINNAGQFLKKHLSSLKFYKAIVIYQAKTFVLFSNVIKLKNTKHKLKV